jgi:hypothetical protein
MRTRNTLTSAFVVLTLALVLAVMSATWKTRQVQAIQDSEDFPSEFGFIDLGAGQTARLNAVNLRKNHPSESDNPPPEPDTLRLRLSFDLYTTPPPDPDAPSCVIRYSFLRRESCDVTLMPGEGASLDYTAAADMKVAATIHSIGNSDTREGDGQLTPEPHLSPMLEVREGVRTLFVVPALIKGFNPQPDPPAIR